MPAATSLFTYSADSWDCPLKALGDSPVYRVSSPKQRFTVSLFSEIFAFLGHKMLKFEK